MTQDDFDKAPKVEQILYDCTGMLARNHPDLIEAMTKYAQQQVGNIQRVSVLLFDFLYYVRNGTQDTPIKEIKEGIKTFLANYKR
ncbi:MAG: hypothetical protein IMY72_11860 [Bacteroidetes bacterium]|nr:hypothetical protein [Bacteroidota bacterium]